MYKNIDLINLIRLNRDYLVNRKISKNYKKYLEKIVEHLNKEKIIIISWIKFSWKTEVVCDFINKTNIWEKVFYFNKELDYNNLIKNNLELENLLNVYLECNKNIKYLIFQNISNIDWIKNFISKIYKSEYKIIIVWNDIKIPNITEIEIKNKVSDKINNDLFYWNIWKTYYLSDTFFKKEYIILNKDSILLNKIYKLKSVKNIFLYNYTITFLAKINIFKSNRDILKEVNENINIAPKTLYDYIDFSISEKIITKIDLYDLKNNKIINWKSKYYFNDNWIRNSLKNFELDIDILKENLIFIYLYYNDFDIFWWKNWNFEFSFIARKNEETIYIHLSKEVEKNEIKKEINKLLKIWNNNKKYLIIDSFEKSWIKKYIYDSVEIIEIENLLQKKW